MMQPLDKADSARRVDPVGQSRRQRLRTEDSRGFPEELARRISGEGGGAGGEDELADEEEAREREEQGEAAGGPGEEEAFPEDVVEIRSRCLRPPSPDESQEAEKSPRRKRGGRKGREAPEEGEDGAGGAHIDLKA